jgi:hypothetical protein
MANAPRKKEFTELYDNLVKMIDVDASDGRSVPNNMNFVDSGFLTKDSGFTLYGSSESELCHSPFLYEKKDGTNYILRAKGTKLQTYNPVDRTWTDIVGSPTFTENAEFGYIVYDDECFFGNAVESIYKFDGTTFTEYASAPKGNILEIFEDRLFVSGVLAEPLSIYYSNTGAPETFTGTDVVKPLGTDTVTNLKNYYGSLLMFKKDSIWKLTFIYDQLTDLYIPKIESQSGTYGACSRKAVAWVENDLWFFTGQELRAIGITDNITGALGINKTVISENIKETLKLIENSTLDKVIVFYHDRKCYLGVALQETEVDTLFVCHTLYQNSWTKYTDRDKAKANGFMVIDEIIYSSTGLTPYGIIKWTVETEDAEDINNALTTES